MSKIFNLSDNQEQYYETIVNNEEEEDELKSISQIDDFEEPLHKRDDSNFSFQIKESLDITNPSTIFESRKQTH